MAVKFIDKNRKNEVCGDEIIARCSCGCGMVSFSAFEDKNINTGEPYKILTIQYFGNSIMDKNKSIASCMYYPDKQATSFIAGLISKTINNGNGVVEDVDGSLLMIEHSKDEKFGESMVIAGFYDERNFKKYIKNPQKGLKYLAWNIHLEEKECNKFIEAIEKLFIKEFDYEVPNKENEKCNDKSLCMSGM
jgi:hypothetical protein